ncbi:hypothetical protein E2K93_12440 [Thalassotalea sp. HSM 43]|uniref:hypothetical protein n=1 Tax=Thalassotalea sp. HSM 43 TaxID=2552945 RepID=UPI0010810858|nr:hypothetical protein [Thalassotalea sp. HSM 43]QBY05141.1 hypothetical protein E2K93_12440 [Thalassotalea sp. HSM 43]
MINRNIQRSTKKVALDYVAMISKFEQSIPQTFEALESAKIMFYPNCYSSVQSISDGLAELRNTWIAERFSNPDIPDADEIETLINVLITQANTLIQFSLVDDTLLPTLCIQPVESRGTDNSISADGGVVVLSNGVEASSISLVTGFIGGAVPDVGRMADGDIASVIDAPVGSIRTLPEHHYSVGLDVPDAVISQVVVSGLDRAFKVTSPEYVVSSTDPVDSDGKPAGTIVFVT